MGHISVRQRPCTFTHERGECGQKLTYAGTLANIVDRHAKARLAEIQRRWEIRMREHETRQLCIGYDANGSPVAEYPPRSPRPLPRPVKMLPIHMILALCMEEFSWRR